MTKEQIEPSFKKAAELVAELFEPSSKKVRGRSKRTKTLIEAMRAIAEETHPITGRGIGYKLSAAGLIAGVSEMNVVYRVLKIAREEGTIPWEWVIDETRELELVSTMAKSVAVRGWLLLPARPVADTGAHRGSVVREGDRSGSAVAGIK
jgi:hypothetical protein